MNPASAAPITGFFPVIRRWIVVIVAAAGVALVIGFVLADRATPTYEARTDLLVGPLNADEATLRVSAAATGTYVQLSGQARVLDVVAQETGVDRDRLYDGVRVIGDEDSRVLTVRARAHTAQDAADAANGVADRLIALAADDSTAVAGRLNVIDEATRPSSPISPKVEVIAPLAAVAGLIAGLGLVMVLELMGDPAGTITDVTRAAGVPSLAVAPAYRRRRGWARAGELAAVQLQLIRPDARSLLLTGTTRHDGGGRVALEVAAAWAPPGGRVTVIDAGVGEITTVLGLGGQPGLAEALDGRTVVPTTIGSTVAALGTGLAWRDHLVTAAELRALVDQLAGDGDRIVVHAPSAATVPTALAWATSVDATVVVARRDSARRAQITQVADALRTVGADVAFTLVHSGGRRGPALSVTPTTDVQATPSRATATPTAVAG